MRTRRAYLGALAAGLAGCTGERVAMEPDPGTETTAPGPTATQTSSAYDLQPVPEPSAAALDRWCGGAAGVADSAITVLGDVVQPARESVARVGFTGSGELHDGPEVVVAGVVGSPYIGEHAHVAAVAFADGRLSLTVRYGYPEDFGSATDSDTPTMVGTTVGTEYVVRVAMAEGFPESVVVTQPYAEPKTVDGPC